ncbi:cAMP-binding domain of CRP or a regulatory subunit of cAMP-dependent protein kinases [Dyadobacter soli]|uniref:cAMP-binding domain of CRP or a regulatory subunit of cAMP-dependent protein kinases n=1 Tax=Dyadobacter soli TaxID=659014 RepID=A0A1G7KS76_9BACT|nr:cyclic nucleotide-binding domain-containing protein [Dyadobacter soli]SDF40011.1 cAMP-binding domain of CRP or a regulatory subunit of cAMP-dependent protein kinases [Dyadobacter soli]
MEESLKLLYSVVQAIHPLDYADWEALSRIWKPMNARRKEIVTSAGDTERYLYFVTDGVQRIYYLDDQHREATLAFTYRPSFGGIIDSLLMEVPSRYYYETLTPSSFIRAPYSEFKEVAHTRPAVERMLRAGMTTTLSGILERLVEVQCFSSEEKFRNLLKRSPHILQLVPHKYLANYLGIDPTNFSKLVNKVRI